VYDTRDGAAPDNGYTCDDGYQAYCSAEQSCNAESFVKGDWDSWCSVYEAGGGSGVGGSGSGSGSGGNVGGCGIGENTYEDNDVPVWVTVPAWESGTSFDGEEDKNYYEVCLSSLRGVS